MVIKKAFQRTCMGCNNKFPKHQLIRIVRNKTNEIYVDPIGNAQGRGAYICNNIECLNKVRKNKRIEVKLKTHLTEKIYEDIRGVIIGK